MDLANKTLEELLIDAAGDLYLDGVCNRVEAELARRIGDADALRAQLAAANERAERAEKAIAWALGESDEFPPREPGQGAYWWRTELRRRARAANDAAEQGGKQ